MHHFLAVRSIATLAVATLPVLCHPLPASAQPVVAAQEATGNQAEGQAIQLDTVTIEGGGEDAASTVVATGEEIEERGIVSIESLLIDTPGVNVNTSGGTNLTSVYIRGVGALYPLSLNDGMVGLTIDGTPLSSRHIALDPFDVDRVEVLKGAQGTRSAGASLAGTVNVVTNKPTREFEGYVTGEYGSYRQHKGEAVASGPLNDALSGRLALRYSGSEHWVTSIETGNPLSDPSELALRGQLLWEIGENTTALFAAERQDIREHPNLLLLKPYDHPPSVSLPADIYDDVRKKLDRYSATLDHRFEGATLTSVTSYVDVNALDVAAYDRRLGGALQGGPADPFWNVDESGERVFDQDLRLSSQEGSWATWLVGMSLEHGDRFYDTPRNTYGSASAKIRRSDTLDTSLYGDATVPLGERTRLSVGLRNTWNETSYSGQYHSAFGVEHDERDLDQSLASGRLGLAYDLTQDVELQTNYTRGRTAAGFSIYSTQIADSVPYRGAVGDTVDLGFRSRTPDGAFELGGSVYVGDVRDNVLLNYDAATFVTRALNADTRSRGAELQATWRPLDGLELSGSLAYVDAQIRSNVFGAAEGDILSGNRVPDVSPWSALLSASYTTPLDAVPLLGEALLTSNLSYRFVGERQADPQNQLSLEEFHGLDMRVGLTHGRTEVFLAGDDLIDQENELYGYVSGGANVAYGAVDRGRSFRLGVTHRF